MRYILLALLLLGCNEEVKKKKEVMYFVDPALVEYYLDFKRDVESIGLELANDNISFSLVLGRTPPNVAGIALGMFNKHCVNIVIDIKLWDYLNKKERKALVYHEMAHDVFGLKHNSCSLMSGGLRGMTESMRLELLMVLDNLPKQPN